MKKWIRKIATIILTMSVWLSFGSMSASAQEDEYFDNELSTYEGENFQVVNCLTDRWDGGYSASFVINNTGDMDIRNWKIRFPAQFEISEVSNAEIESSEDGTYLVRHVGWNNVLEADGCVQFVVMVSENFTGFPVEYEVLGTYESVVREPFESFVKDAKEEDIAFDKDTGTYYVKNQIIISTHLGASKELIKNLAEELDADIVGYIDLIADYQLEFRKKMTYSKLMEKIEYVRELPYVRYAEVNFATPQEIQSFSEENTIGNRILCYLNDNWVWVSLVTLLLTAGVIFYVSRNIRKKQNQ